MSTGKINADADTARRTGLLPLLTGGAAALLASACCLGPLLLVLLGFSGAWMAQLTALEPYQPFFVAIAAVALFFAWRRIYRAPEDCTPDGICAAPALRSTYRLLFWLVALMLLIAVVSPYLLPLFL